MERSIRGYTKLIILFGLLILSSLAYSQEADDDFFAFEEEEFFEDEIADPFEPINRFSICLQ